MSKRIPELDVGTMGIGSLFETAQEDGTSSTGYNSTKVSATDIGNFVARVQTYPGLDNKTLEQAINDAGGGGPANMTELTQAEYDALEQAGLLVEDMMYFITDGQSSGDAEIDDSTTALNKVWSSSKVSSELATKQDSLVGGQLSNVDLNDYRFVNANYWVNQTSVSNKPTTSFGYLEVIVCSVSSSTTIAIQRFTAYGNDSAITRGDTYVRFYVNNQWYSWNKIASSRPEPVKATRTGLTQAASTTSYFTFSGIPVKTGYTRMVTCVNPSEGGLYYLRTVENGDDLRIYMNNATSASVTYDLTIMVEYIAT